MDEVNCLFDVEEIQALKGLQFMHINTRSLYHKMDTLKNDLFNKNTGILGISETWLNANIPDGAIQVDGFTSVRNDRMRGRGGGTCLYVNDRLSFEKGLDSISNTDVEVQSIIVTGNGDNQNHRNGTELKQCFSLHSHLRGCSQKLFIPV